jgi:hypothetical protein
MQIHLQRQLSVAIENAPGRLAAVSALLADRGINIEALSVINNVEQGMLRMLVSDAGSARGILEGAGFSVIEADVLNVELTDRLGKLARLTAALAAANINIEYAYATVDHAGARTRLVLKTTHPRKALHLLEALREDS